MDSAANSVDHDIHLGQVRIDIEILHLLACTLPIGDQNTFETASQQCLYQTLSLGVVGDRRAVAGIRSIDENRRAATDSSRGRKVAEDQRMEIKQDAVL